MKKPIISKIIFNGLSPGPERRGNTSSIQVQEKSD
jgi:hypothetical protein